MLRRLLGKSSPLPHFVEQKRGAGGLSDPALLMRATLLMFTMGGLCGLGTIVLADDPTMNRTAGIVITVFVFAVTVPLAIWGRTLPAWVSPFAAAGGTVIVSTAIAFGGGVGGTVFPLIYIWGALYSFAFFSIRTAILEVLFVALGFSLSARLNGHVPTVYVIMVLGTIAAQSPFVRYLVSEIVELGRVDPLTGIANRRAFEEQMEYVRRDSRRSKRSNALIMLDLDHFKQFNDNRGHVEGDRFLCAATQAWQGALREGDVLARFGGEEFVVLLRDCPPSAAKECADRLRDATPENMTCSAGYAMVQAGEETAHLIARADLALYQAKRSGRNCSVAAPNDLPQDLAVTAFSTRGAERRLA